MFYPSFTKLWIVDTAVERLTALILIPVSYINSYLLAREDKREGKHIKTGKFFLKDTSAPLERSWETVKRFSSVVDEGQPLRFSVTVHMVGTGRGVSVPNLVLNFAPAPADLAHRPAHMHTNHTQRLQLFWILLIH